MKYIRHIFLLILLFCEAATVVVYSHGVYSQIDNLSLTYSGNQLKKVTDSAANCYLSASADFKDYSNTATEYTYNLNGAITKDLNKGIQSITYNHQNLPVYMTINNSDVRGNTAISYSATGQKLRVIHRWENNVYNQPPIQSSINDYFGNIDFSTGRIYFSNGYTDKGSYYFYIRDHLGDVRAVVYSSRGNIVQSTEYYPFGMPYSESSGQNLQPFKYNGKEFVTMNGLNQYDYGFRHYDPALGRFLTIDPLAEKYPSLSPYAYCSNNPMKYIDPDGRDIKLYNVNAVDQSGNLKAQAGLSATTGAAMQDLLKTKEGLAFFSQFAKAGDAIGDYKFTKDGSLSNVTLNLWDYSADDIVMAQSGSGSIGVSGDKKTVTLKVVSNGAGKTEVGETLTHETQVHGYNIAGIIEGKKTTTENKDHKALKNQDTKHQGYKQYKSVQTQLEKIDSGYKKAFEEAKKDYDKDY